MNWALDIHRASTRFIIHAHINIQNVNVLDIDVLMENAPAAALTHVTVLKTALMGLMNLVAVSVYS